MLYVPKGASTLSPSMGVSDKTRDVNLHFSTFMFSVFSTEIVSKVVGESEKALVSIFSKARAAAPCVLFLDHIDTIAGRRQSQVCAKDLHACVVG